MPSCRDIRRLAMAVSAGLSVACGIQASAQTVDYFITPWVVAPLGSPTAIGPADIIIPPGAPSPYSNLYNRVVAQSSITAPPFLFSTNIGIDEIATDNVAAVHDDQQADLGSLFSLGETISADSVRLKGVLSVTGFYRHNLIDSDLDQASEYGYGRGRAIILPDHVFFDVNGLIDDLEPTGFGVQNSIAQSPQNTHMYNLSASPFVVAGIGDMARMTLRYQIGQIWFNDNTTGNPLFGVPPITSSTSQGVTGDFRTPGTIFRHLMSDLSLNASENDSGNPISGNLQRASGELINEYEITRSASVVGGAGYEYLSDSEVPGIGGEGEVWDFGVRVRPTVDSSILLVYGRHDRKSDVAGEIAWRITPLTSVYAKYSDSLTTVQESLISNDANSILGPDGAVSGIAFDHSTLIGVLDEAALSAGPGSEQDIAGLGVPLGTVNGLAPLQNGLFRAKSVSGTATSRIGDNDLLLTAFYQRNLSLTPLTSPSSIVKGTTISWSRSLAERLSANASAGYRHVSGVGNGDLYNASLGADYALSESLAVNMRYDLIRREVAPNNTSYIQNVLTIGVHKSFD